MADETNAKVNRARNIIKNLPEADRANFVSNFKKLDSEEKRNIAIDRLVAAVGGKQPIARQKGVQQIGPPETLGQRIVSGGKQALQNLQDPKTRPLGLFPFGTALSAAGIPEEKAAPVVLQAAG